LSARASIHFNLEFDSNEGDESDESDESDLHDERNDEQRISTLRGITID
jgi:hypothetical protein